MKKLFTLLAICAMAVTSAFADNVCKNTSTSSEYATVQAAVDAVAANQTIQLTADVNLTSTITVASTTPAFTLDLNGHVLNASGIVAATTEGAKASVIYNEGTLTITDSDPTATHTQEGLTTVTGGVLTGGKGCYRSSNENAGGAIYNNGTLTMTGGTITKNSTTRGGGIFNAETMTLSNVKITGNTATSKSGGGIYTGGTLTVKDGSEITNNTAGNYGGGVSMNDGATANLYDCTITGNKAKYCGGVEVWQSTKSTITYNIGGKVVIKDNYLTGGSTKSDLGVYDGGVLTISTATPLTTGSEIGIFTYSGNNVAAAAKFTTNGFATDAKYFFADASDSYHIAYNTSGYLEMLQGGTEAITVNKCGNASYVTTSALDFTNAAIKAYVATEKPDASATSVTLTRVKQVPAGTPIFVFTDEVLTADKSYDVSVGSSTTLTDWTTGATVTSVLEGSTTATKTVNTADETVYALKNTDGKLHKCNDGVVIPAKKAYISVAQYQAKESLDFNFGEATGINNVDANVDVNQAQGKYIENGKIVIVKNGKKFNTAGQLMK